MGKKKLILVVEDNSSNQKIVSTILSQFGYEIGIANDGQAALDFIDNVLPDLILLDIMMPGMDGFEVAKRLKQDFVTKAIPIIFLTAKSDIKDIVKGFNVGGVDYISKPFHPEVLLARVNTHIEISTLRGILPICSYCKKIRDDKGYWTVIEQYIAEHSQAVFSHGICDECKNEIYTDQPWLNAE